MTEYFYKFIINFIIITNIQQIIILIISLFKKVIRKKFSTQYCTSF